MKLTLRRQTLNVSIMSLEKLSRLNNCIKWEMEKIQWHTKVKDGRPPKYEMLNLVRLIIAKKMENKLKNRKYLIINNF